MDPAETKEVETLSLTVPRIKAAIEFWTHPVVMRAIGLYWPTHGGKYFLRTTDSRETYEYSQEEVDFIKAHVLVTHAITRSPRTAPDR